MKELSPLFQYKWRANHFLKNINETIELMYILGPLLIYFNY